MSVAEKLRAEGFAEGFAEGLEEGVLTGGISIYEMHLDLPPTSHDVLLALSFGELETRLAELTSRHESRSQVR